MHGHEVYNSSGSLVLNPYEDSLMYWGRVRVTGTDWVSLFNIPTSENACLFFIGDSEGTWLDTGFASDTTLRARCRVGSGYAGAGWVYVFIKSASVPFDSYGAVFYAADGSIQYHTAAPPLQANNIYPNLRVESGDTTIAPAGSAVLVQDYGAARRRENPGAPDPIYGLLTYRSVGYTSGSSTIVGIDVIVLTYIRGGSTNTWTSFTSGQYVSVITIDTAFYNQFPNRGNY